MYSTARSRKPNLPNENTWTAWNGALATSRATHGVGRVGAAGCRPCRSSGKGRWPGAQVQERSARGGRCRCHDAMAGRVPGCGLTARIELYWEGNLSQRGGTQQLELVDLPGEGAGKRVTHVLELWATARAMVRVPRSRRARRCADTGRAPQSRCTYRRSSRCRRTRSRSLAG